MNAFHKLSIVIFSLMSVSGSPLQLVDTHHHAGRCTGSAYCRVCSNCSRCGHCNSGGTCGVCAVPQENKPQPKKPMRSTTLRMPAAGLPSRSADPGSQRTDNELTDDDLGVDAAVYVVNTQLLNVRSGPSTAYQVKYKLGFGEEVKLLEISDDQWAKIWIEMDAGERIMGYVPVSYLSGK